MRTFITRITLTIILGIATHSSVAQPPDSPHGPISVACNACHTTENWSVLRPDMSFDHSKTQFPLAGRHSAVACAACHTSLVFSEAKTHCLDCHLDIHRGQFAHNACEDCHSPARWINDDEMRTRHQRTRFPLIGVHAQLDCELCHANGQYVNVPVDCQGCHLATYQSTTTPPHAAAGLSVNCEQCHTLTTPGWAQATFSHTMTTAACFTCHAPDYAGTTDPNHITSHFDHDCTLCHSGTNSWRPATFNHSGTRFPLTGAHVSLSCNQCHGSGPISGSPPFCYDCHRANFESVADPNHVTGNFNQDCSICHTTFAWTPATFDHSGTDFPLTGAHVSVACAQCHVNGQFQGTHTDCWSCHEPDFQGVTDPNHVTGSFDHNCSVCHTTGAWSPATFDHSGTNFPLTGAHVSVTCAQCHVNGQFHGTPADCWSCHQANFNEAANHAANQYPHDCTICHSTTAWSPSTFNHNNTPFPLLGAHLSVNCSQCHVNGQFQGTPADCWSCHQSDYSNAENHASGQYPHDCLLCHNMNGWGDGGFNHNGTDFPLTGAHVSVGCTQCHVNGQFQGTPTDCWSCHQANYNGVTDPNHVTGNYDHNCTICHTTTGWSPATFDHSGTDFPLTGAHVSLACAQCHINGQFQGTPTDCWSCHQANYNAVTDPNHVTGNYDHNCTICHTTTGWSPATFDHSGTDFLLTGAHVSLACAQCHINGQFQGTPTDCWSCHQANYDAAANHAANQYPHDCTICHNTVAWQPSTFNHNNTAFPLIGAHITVACNQCHVNGQFQGTPTDCWSCHQNDYNNAENHVSGQYPHDCLVCHNMNGWGGGGGFNHNGTDFPLTGAHVSLACTQCHVNGQFQGTPTDCWSCHQANYQSVTDPNHVTGNYDHDCTICHATTGWSPATFDHSSTNFPMTGAHVSVACAQCHVNGQFQGTPTDCWSCHQANYDGAANHAANQYPHDCTICHNTVAWQPSTFNHNGTAFPLTGAHVNASCAQCHVNGQFQGTPTECYFCHQNDYNNSTNPNHIGAGFPTTCAECHTTSNWTSNWNHLPYFPIYSGSHVGRWDQCSDCHPNPNDYAVFTCTTCHTQQDTDPRHNGVPGYVYESSACYNCHPNGQSGGLRLRRTPTQQD